MIEKLKVKGLTLLFWVIVILIGVSCCENTFHKKWRNSLGFTFDTEYKGDTLKNYEEKITVYYPSGTVNCRYKIVNKMLEGKFIGCDTNGKVHCDKYYIHNKLEGRCKIYYPNHRLADLQFYKDDSLIYWRHYDSVGVVLKNESIPYVKFPKSIHLGEKFKLEFTYPILKGFTDIGDFNAAIIPYNIDSLKDYKLISNLRMNKWVYKLMKKDTKTSIDKFSNPVYNIPLNEHGYGIYEFTPTNLGSYSFKGVSTSFSFIHGDSAFVEQQLNVNFVVIK